MSITTYSELQTAIASWLHRADLTSTIPDFITLAEAKFNRNLRLRAMESLATASVSTEFIDFPTSADTGLTDFLELRKIQINSTDVVPLIYMSPEVLEKAWQGQTGVPVNYSIVANQIQLGPTPDTTYTIEISFYAKLAAISSSTNWLFTNAPDLYVYGALLEAAPFLKDDTAIQRWKMMYDSVMNDLQVMDGRSKFGPGLTMVAV